MNASTTALTFGETKFNVVARQGETWLRASEIAEALGYSRADKITQIFDRNRDEFSPSMTQTLKLRVSGLQREIRLFTLRGAHLIAMFARTERAKEFRRWVLDILDREIARPVKAQPAMSPVALEELRAMCEELQYIGSFWKKVGRAIEMINPSLYGLVFERFLVAPNRARMVCKELGIPLPSKEFCDNIPWQSSADERRRYWQSQNRQLR